MAYIVIQNHHWKRKLPRRDLKDYISKRRLQRGGFKEGIAKMRFQRGDFKEGIAKRGFQRCDFKEAISKRRCQRCDFTEGISKGGLQICDFKGAISKRWLHRRYFKDAVPREANPTRRFRSGGCKQAFAEANWKRGIPWGGSFLSFLTFLIFKRMTVRSVTVTRNALSGLYGHSKSTFAPDPSANFPFGNVRSVTVTHFRPTPIRHCHPRPSPSRGDFK